MGVNDEVLGPEDTIVALGSNTSNAVAPVLKAKGYHYQSLYCLNSGHGVGNAKPQILPHALEWLWHGYPVLQSR